MNRQDNPLSFWSTAEAVNFGMRPMITKHRLHQLDLFSDGTLHDLIDCYPRNLMQAFTMGCDPMKPNEWQAVDTEGASADEILRAVRCGRIWFKLLQVHVIDGRFRELLDQLYAELEHHCPHFKAVGPSATLLVSSPTAMVYYHVDAEPNLLWHIRGSKRVWVYPSGDRDLVSQELMEDIFAHIVDEEAPYMEGFDKKAAVFDLGPGEVISWPLNAPHRVTNIEGVNISLSTLHVTSDSDRRKLVYCANRLLRRKYHIPASGLDETGIASFAKQSLFRVLRRAGVVEPARRRVYMTNLRIDANAPTGFRVLSNGPVLTEFSKADV
jgi:hypothetical protein